MLLECYARELDRDTSSDKDSSASGYRLLEAVHTSRHDEMVDATTEFG